MNAQMVVIGVIITLSVQTFSEVSTAHVGRDSQLTTKEKPVKVSTTVGLIHYLSTITTMAVSIVRERLTICNRGVYPTVSLFLSLNPNH